MTPLNTLKTTNLCPRCQVERPIEEFGKNRSRPSGLKHICKICEKANVVQQVHVSLENIEKECGNCHRTLSSRAFRYSQYSEDKLNDWCRTCRSYRKRTGPTLEQVLEHEARLQEILANIDVDPEAHRLLVERHVIYAFEDLDLNKDWKLPVWVNKKLHGLTGGKKK